ncbi:MAG: energy-coupled thiamine transporter ThiT [Oscillospiraceae bacterium]|nr:energy-coupled thiamine transporter ThiT [Oscillospiraceae bacterium]
MKNKNIRCICEGAVFVAAALALSYLKIPIGFSLGGFGGSIDLVMIPLILFSVRWGLGWGLGAGLIYGTLKFLFAGGVAVNWQSMLLDYSLAYMMVGLAGIMKNRKWGLVIGGFIGCLGRFSIHFVSGVTIYAQYMPPEFLDMTMTTPVVYSLLYNGTYMIPNTFIALIIGAVLTFPLKKYITAADL